MVNADPAFDGNRNTDLLCHGRNAVSYGFGCRHQTGSNAALLNAVAGTTDIEVDLLVTRAFCQPGTFTEFKRIAASELKDTRLVLMVAQEMVSSAMQQRAGRDHF